MPTALALACAVAAAGCGKKGPPLAPIVRIPAAVEKINAERVGSDVYVTLTVPAQNIDASKPADIARIDVYGFTATAPPARGLFLAQADRLAVIPVAPVPRADGSSPPSASTANAAASQGVDVTIRDVLVPDQLVPKPPLPEPATRRPRGAATAIPAVSPTPPAGPPMPRRFYMAIAFSDRGRSSPQGTVADLPLTVTPPPPEHLRLGYSDNVASLAWEPSGGLIAFLTDRVLPVEDTPFDSLAPAPPPVPLASDVPAPPTRYNVYRLESPDPLSLPERPAAAPSLQARPLPLNEVPLTTLDFSDAADFERTQCYNVRAVRGTAGALVEGDPTQTLCITPIDTFPPAVPVNLSAVAAEGSIALIWEPNADPDLGGYLVLRGEAGSATLQPLMDTPIADARYTDRAVTAGTRYVYAVVAVDDRVPVPNMSAESARVEESAR